MFLILTVCLSTFTLAENLTTHNTTPPVGEIVKIKGDVFFNNIPIHLGDKISQKGILETKDKSYIQIKIDKWKNNISVGGNSKMEIDFENEKKYTLEEGLCRWKAFAKSEAKGHIYTKKVSMGVRGTDFLLTTNSSLGETEIIMFDGEVIFENLQNKNNSAILKKGQWGGIGGRFGETIAPGFNLPPEYLENADKRLE